MYNVQENSTDEAIPWEIYYTYVVSMKEYKNEIKNSQVEVSAFFSIL